MKTVKIEIIEEDGKAALAERKEAIKNFPEPDVYCRKCPVAKGLARLGYENPKVYYTHIVLNDKTFCHVSANEKGFRDFLRAYDKEDKIGTLTFEMDIEDD